MSTIILGNQIAAEVKTRLAAQIEGLKSNNEKVPTLAVVLVGDNPASISYVTGKEKACNEVGMNSKMIHLPENTTQAELMSVIDKLNKDSDVNGILVQLPLPKHLNEKEVIFNIDPNKDVDGLHPINVGKLHLQEDGFVPCTSLGVMEMLRAMNIEVATKNVVVVGRSNLVGNPVAQLLVNANATVTVCHSKTKNIEQICRQADILVVAIGRPKFVNRNWVKENAVVIDVGINRVDGKLCGDVDFEDVKEVVSYITPVPKGVGPMTIAMLLQNTLKAYFKHREVL